MTYITKDFNILGKLNIDAGDERKLTVRHMKTKFVGPGNDLAEHDRIFSGDTVLVVLDDSVLRITVSKSLL